MNAVRAYVTIPLWRSPKFWGIRELGIRMNIRMKLEMGRKG